MSSAAVVLTASAGAFPGLLDALRAIPVGVEEIPLMSFAPPLDWGPVDAAVRNLDHYAAIAFTSPRSARAFSDRLQALGTPVPSEAAVWTAGAGTTQGLTGVLGQVRQPDERTVAERGAAAALADALVRSGLERPVLFPCGDIRRDELPARLRDEGIRVDEVVCYRSVLAGEAEARHAAERAQVVIVASPSVAELLARVCPPGARPDLVAVGPTTAAAARASGWAPTRVAARPTSEALAAAVRAIVASH